MTAALFRDATANSLCCSVSSQNSADPQMQNLFYTDLAASTSSTTFKRAQARPTERTQRNFNGWTAGRMRGGVINSATCASGSVSVAMADTLRDLTNGTIGPPLSRPSSPRHRHAC